MSIPENNTISVCKTCHFPIYAWVKMDDIGGEEYIINDWGWEHSSPISPPPIPHDAEPDPDFEVTYRIETKSIGLFKATEERWRQRTKGYSPVHDDEHSEGELARAGACYAEHAASVLEGTHDENEPTHPFWPWSEDEWKPGDPKRALEKAIALLAAEYDKLVRDEQKAEGA